MSDDFGALLVESLPRLRRFAVSLCRSADRGDDLVQRACERALAARDSFRPGTRFDAWMFRILRNLWFDELRRTRTRGRGEDIEDHPDLSDTPAMPEPEARLALGKVMAAIHALPAEQREVLLLVCVEDLSYREAAETIGVPIGTVMSRLARGRQKIAEATGLNGRELR